MRLNPRDTEDPRGAPSDPSFGAATSPVNQYNGAGWLAASPVHTRQRVSDELKECLRALIYLPDDHEEHATYDSDVLEVAQFLKPFIVAQAAMLAEVRETQDILTKTGALALDILMESR